MPRPRYLNVIGPLYVEDGTCITCGAPEAEAPTLMSHDPTVNARLVAPGSSGSADQHASAVSAEVIEALAASGVTTDENAS